MGSAAVRGGLAGVGAGRGGWSGAVRPKKKTRGLPEKNPGRASLDPRRGVRPRGAVVCPRVLGLAASGGHLGAAAAAPRPLETLRFSRRCLVSLFCRVYLCYRSMPARHYIRCLASKWKTVKSLRYQGVSQTDPYTCTLNALILLMATLCSS